MEVTGPKFISVEKLFPRLFKEWPGLIPGTYYAVSGATASGKTKFAKSLFVNHAYEYCKQNDLNLHVLYFALEESQEKFWITILCDLLYERYRTTITYYQYKEYHEGLTPEIKEQIKILEPIIEDMKKTIHVYDMTSNPTGIKIEIEKHLLKIGKKEKDESWKDDNGNTYSSFNYKYNKDNTLVIGVVDHMSLLSPEKNPFNDCSTLHAAMAKLSEYAVKYFCKKYHMIWCDVHQQEMA